MLDTDKYLDIPFSQADCYEFGSILYKDHFGRPLPSFNYELEDAKSVVSSVLSGDTIFVEVKREELRYLDGIIFYSPSTQRHIGFYLGDGKFIHQIMNGYPAIERLDSPIWKKRIIGYRRFILDE